MQNMKRNLSIALLALLSFTSKAQSGTTVIVGFNQYDNMGLYGQLLSEENGVISFRFFDSGVTCKIDRKGNILEGGRYISEKKPGKPIEFIQLYESKKMIVNPDVDITRDAGVFMLLELAGASSIFGVSEYKKETKTFVLQTKPAYKRIILSFENRQWKITATDQPGVDMNSKVAHVYLYTGNSRRFYTR